MKTKQLALYFLLASATSLSLTTVFAAPTSKALTAPKQQPPSVQATRSISAYDLELIKADMNVGQEYAKAGKIDKARAAYTQGLSAARKQLPPNHPLIGLFLVQLSTTYMLDQNFDKACSLLTEGVTILDKTPSLQPMTAKLKNLEALLSSFQSGITALKAQNYTAAESSFQHALVLGKQTGEPSIISISLSSIGLAQVMQDKSQEGEQTLKQALQFADATNMKEAKTMALLSYGELYARRGEITLARQKFDEAVGVGDTMFTRLKITNTLIEQERQRLTIIEQAINAAQTPASAPDYYLDALYHSKVMRWNDQTQSIKIYIASGDQIPGWKPEYIEQFKKACLAWQTALDNRIHFDFTTNPSDDYDTTVTWTGNYAPRTGLTRYNFVANKLIKDDIQFNLGTFDRQLYDPQTVYKLSLHEVGHLLGIAGHSKNPKDIMFPTPTFASQLSPRDTATIHELYAHKPDITTPVGITLEAYQKSQLTSEQQKLIEALDHF